MVELLRNSSTDSKMQLLGPAPAPLSRLKGRFRYHLLIKTTDLKGAGEGIEKVLPDLEKFRLALCRGKKLSKEDLNIIIDVDPVSLL
jgi:primosomal protein N' (replication factor Y)